MKLSKLLILSIVLVFLAAGSVFAAPVYNVSVNTSSLSGTDGYLYFQYVPVNAAESTATVSGFSGGTLAPANASNVVDGSAVTGILPGSVTFANTNGINDYNHGFTFGNSLSFLLSFTDPLIGGLPGGGSTFSLGLFGDESGSSPLITSSGTVFSADLVNDGSVSPVTVAGISSANPVPEAGTMWLLGSGLVGWVGIGRKIRK
jgi:hypothetical protein